MHAEHLQDGTLAISGTSRIETFNRIWAGIGWPDRDQGHFCVVGERLDGRYHCLWEKQGGLWELGNAALEAKDRFLIECIWADTRDTVATSYLRTLDGLCFYEDPEETSIQPASAAEPPTQRDHFRDRDTTATVVPVPERIAANYRSALEKTRGVIMTGGLMIYERNCPRLVYILRQPLEELIASPVMKALVWVICALEEHKGNGLIENEAAGPWYGNPPRPLS